MLLTTDDLLPRLRAQLATAMSVDIAVAWAGPGPALKEILDRAPSLPNGVRAIVSTHGGASNPTALKLLFEAGQLRLAAPPVLFHPKFYLFHNGSSAVCWIGSANLTQHGFGFNHELVYEFADDGAAGRWFETVWQALPHDCRQQLQEYTANWRPPTPAPPSPKTTASLPSKMPGSWQEYILALDRAELFWGAEYGWTVFGTEFSWANTIGLGHEILTQRDLANLDYNEYRALMGIELADQEDGYGLLGSMKGAGIAKNTFREPTKDNLNKRAIIATAVSEILSVSDSQFAAAAAAFIDRVSALEGFSGAIATRLLALARPDRAVSVNRASRDALSSWSGLSATSLGKPSNYEKLLNWFEGIEWYAGPAPEGAREEMAARFRAALVDALAYQPR